jgi:hypothetical protein
VGGIEQVSVDEFELSMVRFDTGKRIVATYVPLHTSEPFLVALFNVLLPETFALEQLGTLRNPASKLVLVFLLEVLFEF